MKKHAKIIGSLGVAAALSMGVFAVPAMANDLIPIDYENAGTSGTTNVQLTVRGEVPTINIVNPLDGGVFIGKNFPVKVNYTDSTRLEYELIYVAGDGTRTSYDLPAKDIAVTGGGTGAHEYSVNIDDYGGKYGDYILRAKAIGAGSAVDMVSFKMISFDFVVKGYEEETNNPIITILRSPGVYKSLIQIFDEDGNAIFEEPVEVILNADGDTDATLPLARYGVPEGEYRIIDTPYDADGNILDANKERTIEYKPAEAPEVPDTGLIFGALGLSKEDAISTGLALLFVCAFFGVLIIAKKSHKEKQQRR